MELEELLGRDFRNKRLFKQAITHRSYDKEHNERLEFLGDAVLQLLISEYLYGCFTQVQEGQLTRMRASLVRKETLAEIANKLGVKKWLKLGRGEKRDKLSATILADTMEAIIGALYLHQGLQSTNHFVKQVYAGHLAQLSAATDFSDAKTRLQEYMQAHSYPLPEYCVAKTAKRGFTIVCKVKQGQAEGQGKTKREAEQQAALAVLSMLENEQ